MTLKTLRARLQARFPEAVLVMLAGAFAMTLAELLLTGHTEESQMIGVNAGVLGLAACLLGLFLQGRWRWLAIGGLLVVTLGGALGTYEHYEEAQEHREKAVKQMALGDEEAMERQKKHGPPPLAPLSLAGLGLMGAVTVWIRRDSLKAAASESPSLAGSVR